MQGNEVEDIDIFISEKNNKQLKLLKGVQTIVKLILKTEADMDFTLNLRVSNQALSVSNFPNRNSLFRVHIPSTEIFQSELSEMSVASITYPNRLIVLPSYLSSNIIN